MKPIIERLLKELESGPPDFKSGHLVDIGDYLRHPYPHEEGYAEVVQQLIFLLTREKDERARTLFFRNIAVAFSYTIDLSEINFGPLIHGLDKRDPQFISNVIYLLSVKIGRAHV